MPRLSGEMSMAYPKLDGLRIAILATDGFEQSELMEPRRALDQRGSRGWFLPRQTGQCLEPQGVGAEGRRRPLLDGADPDAYDALVLPGGVMNPMRCACSPGRWRS